MNKQIFSLFGLSLLLFNNASFSMQPAEQGNNSCAKPPLSCQELEETRLFHPRVAQKYIEGLTAAKIVIDSVLRNERNRAAAADELQDEPSYSLNHFRTPMFLLHGPLGSGKSYAARAIASILERKLTIIDFFRFELKNPTAFIPVQDRLEPILSHNNEPRVVVLEDIEELATYHYEKDKTRYNIRDILPFLRDIEEGDADIVLDPDTKKQDENWMKSRLVILAITSCRDKIPLEILRSFYPVKIKQPNLERRSVILKYLLESFAYTLDLKLCTPEVIGQLAEKTDGFSVGELEKFIEGTRDYALAKPGEGRALVKQEDFDKVFGKYYPYTEIGEATIKAQKEEAERRVKVAAEAEVARQKAAAEEAARRKAAAEEAALKAAAAEKAAKDKWRIWPFS